MSRWRPEVMAFADLMEAQLRANDHKGGWKGCDPHWLHDRLLEEAAELQDAGRWKSDGLGVQGCYARAVAREAADVANFAMMIADVCGGLPAESGAIETASEHDVAYKALGIALAALQHIQGMEPITQEITLPTVMAQHAVDALKEIEALGATSCPNPCGECRGVVRAGKCGVCGWEPVP